MLTCTQVGAYEVHHHHQTEQEMINITDRQSAVLALIEGDEQHLEPIYHHYAYIARETARSTFYSRGVTSIPLEDVEQQAHLDLLMLLHRIMGSRNKGWADVNHHEKYGDCLVLRPWLITSIRGRLKNFITEGGLIRVKKNIFEKEVIEKYGEKKPPKVVSETSISDGKEFILPEAIPKDNTRPEDIVILNECMERLHLTYFEKQILTMRQQSYTLDEIGQALNKHESVISKKLKKIGEKWLSVNS